MGSQQQQQQQQTQLMNESGKMLEYLRKEVYKLRLTNSKLRTDFDLLKENNQRLMNTNASAGSSFMALNQHAKQIQKQNMKLQQRLVHNQELLVQSQSQCDATNDELTSLKGWYSHEVDVRLLYEHALEETIQRITSTHNTNTN